MLIKHWDNTVASQYRPNEVTVDDWYAFKSDSDSTVKDGLPKTKYPRVMHANTTIDNNDESI